jgi:hypothetical protein
MILTSDSGFREKICPNCQHKFLCYTETWVYTRSLYEKSKIYFCSWKCIRQFDKDHEKEMLSRRKKRYDRYRKKRRAENERRSPHEDHKR